MAWLDIDHVSSIMFSTQPKTEPMDGRSRVSIYWIGFALMIRRVQHDMGKRKNEREREKAS